jgi:hypothetical protein
MKLAHALYLTLAASGMLLSRETFAQDSRAAVIRFRKAGDTVAVRGAEVTIDHTIVAVTDSAGIVRIPNFEDGGHIVEAVATGYQVYFDNFVSGPGVPTPIDLEIQALVEVPKPKTLPTELRLSDFEKRRALAQGKFFTLAQLKAASDRPLANFLKVDAGAYLASGPHGESYLALRGQPSAAAPCYATVVRDGRRLYPVDALSPPNLDRIFTDDLASFELYPGAVPAELGVASKCGALVLWSRRPAP